MLSKMTVGKIPSPPVGLFCVIYEGLTAALNHLKQSDRSAFPWPCPVLLLSDPNPFHLLALSNFTHSSRSLSWKRGIWPARPENRSLFLSPGRRSTAPRPPFAQNYEGYFRCSNLKNTWDTQNTHSEERNTQQIQGDRWSKRLRRPSGHASFHPHTSTRVSAPLPRRGGGLRTHTDRSSSGDSRPSHRCEGRVGLIWGIWDDFRSCRAFKHLCEVLTVSIAFSEIHHLSFKEQSCRDSFSKFATFRFLLLIRLSEPQRIFFLST